MLRLWVITEPAANPYDEREGGNAIGSSGGTGKGKAGGEDDGIEGEEGGLNGKEGVRDLDEVERNDVSALNRATR